MVVVLEDLSSNGTFINGEIVSEAAFLDIYLIDPYSIFQIGKGKHKQIKNGDEVIILKEGEQVPQKDEIGFIFVILKDISKHPEDLEKKSQAMEDESNSNRRRAQELVEAQEDKKIKEKEEQAMKQKINKMGEELECGICYLTMFQAVTLMPCLHNYCGSCFSDWMAKSKECPNCRHLIQEVKKNSSVNSLIDYYLQLNPHLQREQ